MNKNANKLASLILAITMMSNACIPSVVLANELVQEIEEEIVVNKEDKSDEGSQTEEEETIEENAKEITQNSEEEKSDLEDNKDNKDNEDNEDEEQVLGIIFEDENLEKEILSKYDLNNDGIIKDDEALEIITLDFTNISITTLSGIEKMLNLEEIKLIGTNLKVVDLSMFENLALVEMDSNLEVTFPNSYEVNSSEFNIESIAKTVNIDNTYVESMELDFENVSASEVDGYVVTTELDTYSQNATVIYTNESTNAKVIVENVEILYSGYENKNEDDMNNIKSLEIFEEKYVTVEETEIYEIEVDEYVTIMHEEYINKGLEEENKVQILLVNSNEKEVTLSINKESSFDTMYIFKDSILYDVRLITSVVVLPKIMVNGLPENCEEDIAKKVEEIYNRLNNEEITMNILIQQNGEMENAYVAFNEDMEIGYIVVEEKTIGFLDSNLETAALEAGDENQDGKMQASEATNISKLDISNIEIFDLSGIEYLTNLEEIYVTNTNLESIDLSAFEKLSVIEIDTNVEIIFPSKYLEGSQDFSIESIVKTLNVNSTYIESMEVDFENVQSNEIAGYLVNIELDTYSQNAHITYTNEDTDAVVIVKNVEIIYSGYENKNDEDTRNVKALEIFEEKHIIVEESEIYNIEIDQYITDVHEEYINKNLEEENKVQIILVNSKEKEVTLSINKESSFDTMYIFKDGILYDVRKIDTTVVLPKITVNGVVAVNEEIIQEKVVEIYELLNEVVLEKENITIELNNEIEDAYTVYNNEDIIGTIIIEEFIEETVEFNDKNLEAVILNIADLNNDGELQISEAAAILELDLSNVGITDLTGLEKLINLETLNLNNNNISGLDKISMLTNLNGLTLSNNKLVSLEGLENLVNLEHLDISYNEIEGILNVENLINIYSLTMYDTNISSIEGIENLSEIYMLTAVGTNLTGTMDLSKLENLTTIYLTRTEGLELTLPSNYRLNTSDLKLQIDVDVTELEAGKAGFENVVIPEEYTFENYSISLYVTFTDAYIIYTKYENGNTYSYTENVKIGYMDYNWNEDDEETVQGFELLNDRYIEVDEEDIYKIDSYNTIYTYQIAKINDYFADLILESRQGGDAVYINMVPQYEFVYIYKNNILYDIRQIEANVIIPTIAIKGDVEDNEYTLKEKIVSLYKSHPNYTNKEIEISQIEIVEGAYDINTNQKVDTTVEKPYTAYLNGENIGVISITRQIIVDDLNCELSFVDGYMIGLKDSQKVSTLRSIIEADLEDENSQEEIMVMEETAEEKVENTLIGVYNHLGEEVLNNDIVCTGYTIKIQVGEEEKTYIAVINGDVNQDGNVTSIDAYYTLLLATESRELTEEQNLATVPQDGRITSTQAYRILLYSVGLIEEL